MSRHSVLDRKLLFRLAGYSYRNSESPNYGSLNRSCLAADGSADINVNTNLNKDAEQGKVLHMQPSGVWIYLTKGVERLVPIESTFNFTEQKQVTQALNDAFAKAYYGCKVWEAELTAKPQQGTGFMNYITPSGQEVFFPMSWCFEECPPAFFLTAEKSPEEIGYKFSYVNIYTSLADSDNTGLVDSYCRVFSDEDPREDIIQTSQLVAYTDDRVTVTPETVSPETTNINTTISSITSQPSTAKKNGLSNQVPSRVGFFEIESGQVLCRDESKWDILAARKEHRQEDEQALILDMLVSLRGLLPPSFVPVEEAHFHKNLQTQESKALDEFKCDPPNADLDQVSTPEELFKLDLDGNPISLQPRSYVIPLDQF